MKCPMCDSENPESQKFCGDCGAKLETPTTRQCVGCGREIQFDAMICQYCGYDYRQKFRGGAEDKATSRLLSYGLVVTGIWILVFAASRSFRFYSSYWMFIDIGVGVVLLILGLRSLTPKER